MKMGPVSDCDTGLRKRALNFGLRQLWLGFHMPFAEPEAPEEVPTREVLILCVGYVPQRELVS